jgi:hypothetical protein
MKPLILSWQIAETHEADPKYILNHFGDIFDIGLGSFVKKAADLPHCVQRSVTVQDLPMLIAYGLLSEQDYKQLFNIGCLPPYVVQLWDAMCELASTMEGVRRG